MTYYGETSDIGSDDFDSYLTPNAAVPGIAQTVPKPLYGSASYADIAGFNAVPGAPSATVAPNIAAPAQIPAAPQMVAAAPQPVQPVSTPQAAAALNPVSAATGAPSISGGTTSSPTLSGGVSYNAPTNPLAYAQAAAQMQGAPTQQQQGNSPTLTGGNGAPLNMPGVGIHGLAGRILPMNPPAGPNTQPPGAIATNIGVGTMPAGGTVPPPPANTQNLVNPPKLGSLADLGKAPGTIPAGQQSPGQPSTMTANMSKIDPAIAILKQIRKDGFNRWANLKPQIDGVRKGLQKEIDTMFDKGMAGVRAERDYYETPNNRYDGMTPRQYADNQIHNANEVGKYAINAATQFEAEATGGTAAENKNWKRLEDEEHSQNLFAIEQAVHNFPQNANSLVVEAGRRAKDDVAARRQAARNLLMQGADIKLSPTATDEAHHIYSEYNGVVQRYNNQYIELAKIAKERREGVATEINDMMNIAEKLNANEAQVMQEYNTQVQLENRQINEMARIQAINNVSGNRAAVLAQRTDDDLRKRILAQERIDTNDAKALNQATDNWSKANAKAYGPAKVVTQEQLNKSVQQQQEALTKLRTHNGR